MGTDRLAGLLTGFAIGCVLIAFLLKFANRNHRMKTEYDERQQVLRGRGYMYAFYTMLMYEVLMVGIKVGEISLPIPDYILHFAGLITGCVVLAGYCIWNDVYWGLNNNYKRYGIVFALLAVFNAFPVIGALTSGELVVDGMLNLPFLNLLVLVMMLILGIMMLVKRTTDKGAEEDV